MRLSMPMYAACTIISSIHAWIEPLYICNLTRTFASSAQRLHQIYAVQLASHGMQLYTTSAEWYRSHSNRSCIRGSQQINIVSGTNARKTV